ncbi:acetyltransferase (GNAT) family protein [Kribbella amoyensis]|uniref:Acetyltransferase (GNAT) family protein n=1 Tax=Kribbella amoyensis TaxID=996641 RepID=A0A561BJP6_9ACTN|nr:GNAT family N-acetyltransferase [Kribbella amoyensis]TWD79094.1 acetyltransferase (GNAT) family protein [Kribbella amoyensis]
MELRPFDPRYAQLVATWATTAQEVALLCGREEYPFPPDLLPTWRKADDDIRPYLYHDGERPIGYAELWLDAEEDEVELARIILAPEYRGKGLGPAFVEVLLVPARTAGLTDIFLRVRPDNVPAIRTYHRAGFHEVAETLAAEWNKQQPIQYTWMQYPAE